jgi:excisionase family DNA binding protein
VRYLWRMTTKTHHSVKEAARISGLPRNTIYRACARGDFPARKMGKDWRIDPDGFAEYVAKLNGKAERVDTARRSYAERAGELAELRADALVTIAEVSAAFLGTYEAICNGDTDDDAASFDTMTVGLFRAALDKPLCSSLRRGVD